MLELEPTPNQLIHLEHEGISHSFSIDSIIGGGNHQVFKIRNNSEVYALKIYPSNDKSFNLEKRFSFLSHPRLLPILLCPPIRSTSESEESDSNGVLTPYCHNGTLLSALLEKNVRFSPILVRSLFKQLVEAVEYLHESKVAHLDIKLDNIFLDENCNLKLGDFDQSYKEGDGRLTMGTPNYRAPEMASRNNYDPYMADIYSLGIVLFIMASGDLIPFNESQPSYYNMIKYRPERFWDYVKEKEDIEIFGDLDFRALFQGMVHEDPAKRFTLNDIKKSPWYLGESFDDQGITDAFMKF